MSKFIVQLMTVYMTWEGIEAESEDEAIRQCDIPPEFDCNEPFQFFAIKQEEQEDE